PTITSTDWVQWPRNPVSALETGFLAGRNRFRNQKPGFELSPTLQDASPMIPLRPLDRKSTRLNSSHVAISYAVFCLKKTLDADVAIELCELIHACVRTAERHGASGSVGVCEATSPGGSTQEFAQTRACNRDVCESVFFTGVSRDVVFAGTAGVHKFDLDIFANAFQMTITPHLPGRSCCRTASLFRRTIVGAASGMSFNLIRWTPNDVN